MTTSRLSVQAATPAGKYARAQKGYEEATIMAVEGAHASTVQIMVGGKTVTAKSITDHPFKVGDLAWAMWTADGYLLTGSQ